MNATGIDMARYPSLIAEAYRPLLFDRHRHMVLCGGAGSGKSHFSCQKIIYRAFTESGTRHLVVRKIARTIRRSCFALILQQMESYDLLKFCLVNKTEMTIDIPLVKSQILFAGMDDPEKLKSIASITSVYFEEVSEGDEADYDQITLRLRGPHAGLYYQIVSAFNPVLPQSEWLRQKFFVRKHPDSIVLKSTYRNNEFLDAEYCALLEGLKDQNPELYAIYTNGDYYFERSSRVFRNLLILDESAWPQVEPEYYGLDFGFTHPNALIALSEYDGRLYCRQILYQSGLTAEDLVTEFKSLRVRKDIAMYCDSATPGNIESLRRAGYQAIQQKKDPGSVLAGINLLNGLVSVVLRDGDTDMCTEMQGYAWREHKGQKYDEPVKINDHSVDAIRAAYYTRHEKELKKKSSGIRLRRA